MWIESEVWKPELVQCPKCKGIGQEAVAMHYDNDIEYDECTICEGTGEIEI